MRKILIAILLLPFISKAQTSILPKENGKVTYSGIAQIENNNMRRTVKVALANYVSYYNGLIERETNKMRDYISYEDDSTIIANVRFYVRQSMRVSMFTATVTFTKQNEKYYKIKATDFLLSKSNDVLLGQINTAYPVENFDDNKSKKWLGKLDYEVRHFFNYF